jgi:hypothetical protein
MVTPPPTISVNGSWLVWATFHQDVGRPHSWLQALDLDTQEKRTLDDGSTMTPKMARCALARQNPKVQTQARTRGHCEVRHPSTVPLTDILAREHERLGNARQAVHLVGREAVERIRAFLVGACTNGGALLVARCDPNGRSRHARDPPTGPRVESSRAADSGQSTEEPRRSSSEHPPPRGVAVGDTAHSASPNQ